MDKITLLRALLNSEDDFTDLLHQLHSLAKADGPDFGLPIYDEAITDHMKLIVKQWLCKLVLKV